MMKPRIAPLEDMLTREEASRFLSLPDRRLLDQLAKNGQGPVFYQFSPRKLMYSRDELIRWREAQKIAPKDPSG